MISPSSVTSDGFDHRTWTGTKKSVADLLRQGRKMHVKEADFPFIDVAAHVLVGLIGRAPGDRVRLRPGRHRGRSGRCAGQTPIWNRRPASCSALARRAIADGTTLADSGRGEPAEPDRIAVIDVRSRFFCRDDRYLTVHGWKFFLTVDAEIRIDSIHDSLCNQQQGQGIHTPDEAGSRQGTALPSRRRSRDTAHVPSGRVSSALGVRSGRQGRDKVTGNDRSADNPCHIRPHGVHEQEVVGIRLLAFDLGDAGRHRHR